jgi:hypothetical protein
MIPALKNIKRQLINDTFEGVRFRTSPVTDLTGATIRTQFRKGSKTNSVSKSLSIGSGITVEDLLNGVFVWDSFIMGLSVGKYFYDVEITFLSGDVKTYVEGTMEVTQDTSYD